VGGYGHVQHASRDDLGHDAGSEVMPLSIEAFWRLWWAWWGWA
jgi:hypothetical protein